MQVKAPQTAASKLQTTLVYNRNKSSANTQNKNKNLQQRQTSEYISPAKATMQKTWHNDKEAKNAMKSKVK